MAVLGATPWLPALRSISIKTIRHITCVASDANPAVTAFKTWNSSPVVVDFDIDRKQSIQRFEQYQSEQCKRLHVRNLLNSSSTQLTQAFLPFWLFDATIKVEYRASLGFIADKNDPKSERVWTDMDDWKTLTHSTHVPYTQPFMQVYASYELRRDLAEGAKVLDPLLVGRPMSLLEAESLSVLDATQPSSTPAAAAASCRRGSSKAGSSKGASTAGTVQNVQAPHMRPGVAWQLAYRGIMHAQAREAERKLLADTGAAEVREVKVNLQVLRRTCRLAYLPAYVADYQFGDKHTPGKEIVPETFQALIGGAAGSQVVAEAHFSPFKAQLTTASTVGAAVLAGGPLAAPLLGMEPLLGMGGVDIAFWAFLTASAAGVLVRKMPQTKRNQHMVNQVRAELEFYRRYDAHDAPTPDELSDDHTQWLWMDADWRKWEGEDPWSWKAGPRRAWAEALLQQQAKRARERASFKRRLEQERKRQMEDLDREAQKQGKYGQREGPHYGGAAFTRDGQYGEAGPTVQQRRLRDFLGYYRLLGLDTAVEVSTEDIKVAFKKTALQLHPDRLSRTDEAAKQRAQEGFIKVQLAYEVLRDPERRRLYDRGQLVQ